MTPKELAAKLDGREYRSEINREEAQLAKDAGLVVVFGGSDDLCELRGAIYDEASCYDGDTISFDPEKCRVEVLDLADEEVLEKHGVLEQVLARFRTFEARWNDEGNPCWTYDIPWPHETFRIMEDGEVYCIGAVFALNDAQEHGA